MPNYIIFLTPKSPQLHRKRYSSFKIFNSFQRLKENENNHFSALPAALLSFTQESLKYPPEANKKQN